MQNFYPVYQTSENVSKNYRLGSTQGKQFSKLWAQKRFQHVSSKKHRFRDIVTLNRKKVVSSTISTHFGTTSEVVYTAPFLNMVSPVQILHNIFWSRECNGTLFYWWKVFNLMKIWIAKNCIIVTRFFQIHYLLLALFV